MDFSKGDIPSGSGDNLGVAWRYDDDEVDDEGLTKENGRTFRVGSEVEEEKP